MPATNNPAPVPSGDRPMVRRTRLLPPMGDQPSRVEKLAPGQPISPAALPGTEPEPYIPTPEDEQQLAEDRGEQPIKVQPAGTNVAPSKAPAAPTAPTASTKLTGNPPKPSPRPTRSPLVQEPAPEKPAQDEGEGQG
jgi:hypothetical protein